MPNTVAADSRADGYSDEDAAILGEDLRRVAAVGRVVGEESAAYGTKIMAEGAILTPRGTTIVIRAVWFAGAEGAPLRFVTAYPTREGR